MPADVEVRRVETTGKADEPNIASLAGRRRLAAGGGGNLLSGDAGQQPADPRMPAEVVFVAPEVSGFTGRAGNHVRIHLAPAGGHEQDAA